MQFTEFHLRLIRKNKPIEIIFILPFNTRYWVNVETNTWADSIVQFQAKCYSHFYVNVKVLYVTKEVPMNTFKFGLFSSLLNDDNKDDTHFVRDITNKIDYFLLSYY